MTWVGLLIGSYLLGSISWSYLIVRRLHGIDVRQVGSGNAGATNVLRISGTLPALVALVLDAAKGAVAVLAAQKLGAPGPVIGGAALGSVVGHLFPLYHGFRGGKGVATATGALVALAPRPAALTVLVFLMVTLLTRYVSIASMSAVTVFPPLVLLCAGRGWTAEAPTWLLVSSTVIAVAVVCKHHDNIRRLRRGTELKLGQLHSREEAI